MTPSKEEFRENIIKLREEKQKQKEKDYLAYVKGAVERMKPKNRGWKMKGVEK